MKEMPIFTFPETVTGSRKPNDRKDDGEESRFGNIIVNSDFKYQLTQLCDINGRMCLAWNNMISIILVSVMMQCNL